MANRTTVNISLTRELKAKLERGAAQASRGELLDGDATFEELRQLIEERRRAQKDELQDCLDLRDPKVKAQIRQGSPDIRAGRVRPAKELLKELKATTAEPSRRAK